MNTQVKHAIIAHALAAPHEEVCGLVYHTENAVYAHPCANISSESRAETFEISSDDYIKVCGLGRVCGLYHSNPTHEFSEEDLAMAREMCLPLHSYVLSTGKWASYVPETYHVEPVGLEFVWGQWDCLETVRIHYRQKHHIYIADYERDESFEQNAGDIISRHVADEGFSYVDKTAPILVDDVLLFKSSGKTHAQHLGVVVGPNQLLHHPRNQLSRIDSIDGAWLRRLVGVLRYTGKVTHE